MGITISPHPDDPHIVLVEFDTVWSVDDLMTANAQADDYAASVAPPVFIVSHIPPGTKMPAGILMRSRDVMSSLHENIALSIVVTDSTVVQTFYKLFSTLFKSLVQKQRLLMVRSLEEAYTTIDEYRTVNATE